MKDATNPPQAVFQERWVEADGFRLKYLSNYQEGGQGNPVVILDGPSGGLEKLHDALALRYRVIALELPGFGSSPANTRSRSAQDLADTTAQALASIAPEQYTLIGTSFGANVALWQTLQDPNSVEALILISPTSLLPTASPIDAAPAEMAGRLFAHPENALSLSSSAAAVVAKELSLADRLGGSVHDAEVEQRLSEIQCATLVVFGSQDQLVSPQAASFYRANIPNCNVSIVYDAGHGIAAERPEALGSTVVDFVDRRETFVVGYRSSFINP